MFKWLKRLFCKHNYMFHRNIYGDEIISAGFTRSIWFCSKCGKCKRKPTLHLIGDTYE